MNYSMTMPAPMVMATRAYRPLAMLRAGAALSSSSEPLPLVPVDLTLAAVAVAASWTAALAFSRVSWHWLSILGEATCREKQLAFVIS